MLVYKKVAIFVFLNETVTQKDLNNPEWRWYHKKELSHIMPYATKRKELGIKVIDYHLLRSKNNNRIKPSKNRSFDWVRFKMLVFAVPEDLDRNNKRHALTVADRFHFEHRDRGICHLCRSVSRYDSDNACHLHHIISNDPINDSNIISLCEYCHQIVHLGLYLTGRWSYANVRNFSPLRRLQ